MGNYLSSLSAIKNCSWDTVQYLIISKNVFANYIYYSHLLPMFVSAVVGIFIFLQNPRSRLTKTLLIITSSFSLWVIFDLIIWATDKPGQTMFLWSSLIFVEPVIYIGCLYLMILFSSKKLPSERTQILLLTTFIPLIFLASTKYNLIGFNLTNCDREAFEGPLWYYVYGLELLITGSIIITGIKGYLTTKRKDVLQLTFGLCLFLFAFSWSNISGSINVDWDLSQYGLFGMPIFLVFLGYLIIKYKTFDIKMIGAQALVAILWFLTFGTLFIRTIGNVKVIVVINLFLTTIFGYFLIKSVKREVEAREYALSLAEDLSKSNDKLFELNQKLKELDRQKTEFVSMASHQLRTPLTAIKGYSSMLLEGSFGELSDKTRGAVDVIYQSSQRLVSVIEDFLNITRIELGKMKYDVTVFDIRDLVKNVTDELIPFAKRKKLQLNVTLGRGAYQISADYGKMSQVISNVIDNAIKYTPTGSVSVEVTRPVNDPKHIHIIVKDTGVGIAAESIPKLFQKFIRADEVGKTHISGTGLGLYVVKQILDAHKATINIESPGVGKGSTFSIILNSYQETVQQKTEKTISEFADNL